MSALWLALMLTPYTISSTIAPRLFLDADDQWQSHQVLSGDEIARLRRMIYGLERAPDDFICRKCVFALAGT